MLSIIPTRSNLYQTMMSDYINPFKSIFKEELEELFYSEYWTLEDGKYSLEVDVPGYKQSELSVNIKDKFVIIEGENKKKGKIKYKFSLPRGVKDFSAELDLGVLKLTTNKIKDINEDVKIKWKE